MNDLLRDHVTKTQFVLTLSKTHIAAFVQVDEMVRRNRALVIRYGTPFGKATRGFVPGMKGLLARGLLEHTMSSHNKTAARQIWKITSAGKLVIELLKECGIWQEYVAMLESSESKDETEKLHKAMGH